MKKILKNKYVNFGIAISIFLFFVIWIGNYWLLFGIPFFVDFYITKKVNWTFWKKKGVKKQTKLVEWIDALIFAVIAASIIRLFFIEAFTIPTGSMEKSLLVGDYLFVSKVSYGPKMPNTPLSFPFAHHTLPWTKTTKSYLEWIKRPYNRLAGFTDIKNNDVVVFNYPDGDTVALNQQNKSYYQLCRDYGRDVVWQNDLINPRTGEVYKNYFGEIVYRPVDKRENYIKRCVAIAGDSLEIIDGQLYINNKPQENAGELQYKYLVVTNGDMINPKVFDKLGISDEDEKAGKSFDPAILSFMSEAKKENLTNIFVFPMVEENIEKFRSMPNVKSITRIIKPKNYREEYIFPHTADYKWNEDNFGPLWIPKEGVTIDLNIKNLALYERIIDVYEANDLEVKGDSIYINGELAEQYTFKMDYYFMMGDSRHNSADSRFWGFVPTDHIVGKALFIWLSTDKDEKFPRSIRWNRFLMGIR